MVVILEFGLVRLSDPILDTERASIEVWLRVCEAWTMPMQQGGVGFIVMSCI